LRQLPKDKQRSQYFQAIARYFFAQRGAPFWLSSKELDLIARWEKAGIPLKVVLEGMKRAFQKARARQKTRVYLHSLLYCDFEVNTSFEQFKERRVGGRQVKQPQKIKKDRARAAIDKFIKSLPSSLGFLQDIYSQVRDVLCQKTNPEEELEHLEEQIEELLVEHAAPEEKEMIRTLIKKEYDFINEQQFNLMWRIKLVKYLREKYKVPYVSLYYY